MAEERREGYGHLLKYTGVFGGIQGLNVVMALVRNKFVAVLLGPAGMGLVTLFNTTVNFISQATNLGIAFSAVRHLSELYDEGDTARVSHYVRVIRAWCLLTALLGMFVCVVLGPVLNAYTFSWGDHTWHFVLLAPAVGMVAITGGETAILKGAHRLGALAVIQIFSVVVSLLVSVPVYYLFGMSGIVPVIDLMALAAMCFTLYHSHRLFPYCVSGYRGVFGEGMEMVRLGVAFTLAGVIGSASEMFIRSFLNVEGDLDVVGLYNVGFMIAVTYAGIVFSSMESDFFPRLSAVNHNVEDTNLTVNKQMEVSILIASPLLAALIVVLPLLIPLLFTLKFMPVVPMAQVAVLGMFFKAVTLPVAYITLARGLSTFYLMLETAYYVVLLVLMYFFYHLWGLLGTGYAITLANVFDFCMIHAVAKWQYGYRITGAVVKYGAIQILIGLLTFFTTLTVDGFAYWIFGTGLTVVSLLFSLVILHQKTHLWEALKSRFPKMIRH